MTIAPPTAPAILPSKVLPSMMTSPIFRRKMAAPEVPRLFLNWQLVTLTLVALLIYTAAGDSEGSMGGLVRVGQSDKLGDIIEKAILKASWCSSDPICIESKGQGPSGQNLAACHACALLPETSCELMNLMLDRSMVVGTLEDPSIGFFSEVIS